MPKDFSKFSNNIYIFSIQSIYIYLRISRLYEPMKTNINEQEKQIMVSSHALPTIPPYIHDD